MAIEKRAKKEKSEGKEKLSKRELLEKSFLPWEHVDLKLQTKEFFRSLLHLHARGEDLAGRG